MCHNRPKKQVQIVKIEIVEFYETKRKGEVVFGTAHIYIIDWEMDVRGVRIKKCKQHKRTRIYVGMPRIAGIDHETKKPIEYSAVDFTDKKKKSQFLDTIKQKMYDYFLKNAAP